MDQEAICEAIAKLRIVSFHYVGSGSSWREVEPHMLGIDAQGTLTLAGWQRDGGSGIGWRDFHISKISGFTLTKHSFPGPRPGFNPRDRTLARIICCL